MTRLVSLALVLALPWPLNTLVPDWVDRVRYNSRERTATAIEAAAEGDADAALKAAETAYEIAPRTFQPPDDGLSDAESGGAGDEGDSENRSAAKKRVDPRVAFNTGTAHLDAGKEKRAVELLRQAAADLDASGEAGLAPTAHYNLGNAQLSAGDTAGAVASYKESLRRDPDDADAKHNLEVALRRLKEERKMQTQEPQETPGGDEQGEDEQGDQGGGNADTEDDEESQSQPRDPGEGEDEDEQPGQNPPPQPPPEPEDGEGEEPQPRSDALRDFEDQPDMTAEQARALLESVENLERRQRQEEAAELQRRQAEGRKDW